MSKLSFRARALDATKLMPVYRCDELPDLQDFTAISRAVPQMPTGMEKEEECEHHLQRAISAQQAYGHTGELVIPTPECVATPDSYYNDLYPETYKLPRQLIHVQPSAIEQSLPEYDIDSDDEIWLAQQNGLLDVLKFEEIIEILEKSSGTNVVELKDAKKLIKNEDECVISAVYDYWLNKRLKEQHPLIPLVKTEKRDGHSNSSINNNNPYIAFRRRTEKMQTRKNRKNDETSYEKMLKLKRDLSKAVNLLKLIENREKLKRDHLKLTVDLFEKRYNMGDFSGHILAEISALKHIKPSNNYISLPNSSQHRSQFDKSQAKVSQVDFECFNDASTCTRHTWSLVDVSCEHPLILLASSPPHLPPSLYFQDEIAPSKRPKAPTATRPPKRPKNDRSARPAELVDHHDYILSSDDETTQGSAHPTASDQEEDDPDGPYAFRRMHGCSYHAPLISPGNWPWESPFDGGTEDPRHRFCLSTLSTKPQQPTIFGYFRRRMGRGGR